MWSMPTVNFLNRRVTKKLDKEQKQFGCKTNIERNGYDKKVWFFKI